MSELTQTYQPGDRVYARIVHEFTPDGTRVSSWTEIPGTVTGFLSELHGALVRPRLIVDVDAMPASRATESRFGFGFYEEELRPLEGEPRITKNEGLLYLQGPG